MNNSAFFKAVLDSDNAPIVLCNLDNIIVYMNPAAIERYNTDLTGKSLMDCHNGDSNEKIQRVVAWFEESRENNSVFTYHSVKENKDVYMIALRDNEGNLLGYYEKHSFRNPETNKLYRFE